MLAHRSRRLKGSSAICPRLAQAPKSYVRKERRKPAYVDRGSRRKVRPKDQARQSKHNVACPTPEGGRQGKLPLCRGTVDHHKSGKA